MNKLESIIGLEIHLEVNTKSKLFCKCINEYRPEKPNVNICPICLGHPGVLPVLNQQAIEKVLIFGLSVNGKVSNKCWFDRKNYFYPDLPKGYQVSQYGLPLIQGGFLQIDINEKEEKIMIERVHLEEDTAKLLHLKDGNYSLIDFNRAGVPLMEIVTNPDIRSPKQAKIFVQELQLIARQLDVSTADMERGQLRCDVNISLRPVKSKKQKYYPKTEIKNLNSFKAIEDSLIYEISRQEKLWRENKIPQKQTTRGWDDKKHITFIQRSKEQEQDYRYFPEPDLPALDFSKKYKKGFLFDIDKICKSLPELPIEKRKRFIKLYGFNNSQALTLTRSLSLADFTEKVISELRAWLISLQTIEGSEQQIWEKNKKQLVKLIANWLINRLIPLYQDSDKHELIISPENFSEFIILIYEKKVSSTLGQNILEKMFETGKDVDRVVSDYNLRSVKDKGSLKIIIKNIIKNNPEIVGKYKKGRHNVIHFLVGMVMKQTKGQGDPNLIRGFLEKELK